MHRPIACLIKAHEVTKETVKCITQSVKTENSLA